jgi:oxygen-independent coproporphyrinogen-3 oxidase
MLGFGASSIGNMPQGYVQNTSAVAEYARSVANNALPIARGLRVSDEDKLLRDAINTLMCDLSLDVGALCEQHGEQDSRLDYVFERLADPLDDGLMTLDDRTIQVTEAGRPLVRVIAAAFDEYLVHAKARHSVAI